MTVNWIILGIVLFIVIILVVYLVKKNLRDEKDLEKFFKVEEKGNLEKEEEQDSEQY